MVWHLFEKGKESEICSACENGQSLGPFKTCVIPSVQRADGACTNCIFMGRGALCSHRNREYFSLPIPLLSLTTWAIARTPKKKHEEIEASFEAFRDVDLEHATSDQLTLWHAAIQTELRRHEVNPGVKTPGQRKRSKQE